MMFATVVQLNEKDLFVGMVFTGTVDEQGYDHWHGKPITKEYDTMEGALSHLLILYPDLDIVQ